MCSVGMGTSLVDFLKIVPWGEQDQYADEKLVKDLVAVFEHNGIKVRLLVSWRSLVSLAIPLAGRGAPRWHFQA